MNKESNPSSSKAKRTVLDFASPAKKKCVWTSKNCSSWVKNTVPLSFSYTRTHCHSMLLICWVWQLWLTIALHLVNKTRGTNMNQRKICIELLDSAYELHFNWLQRELWSMAKHYSLIASDWWSNVDRQHITSLCLLVRRVWWWPRLYGWGTETLEGRAAWVTRGHF